MGPSTTRTLAFVALGLLLLTSSCATLFSTSSYAGDSESIVFNE